MTMARGPFTSYAWRIMRWLWLLPPLLTIACSASQPMPSAETPASVWRAPPPAAQPMAPMAAQPAKAPLRDRRGTSATGAAVPEASAPPMTPERLATTMVAALDRTASQEAEERRRKSAEDEARWRSALDGLGRGFDGGFGVGGLGGLGTRGGSVGNGSGLGLGGFGTRGSGRGGSAAVRGGGAVAPKPPPAQPPKAPAKTPAKR